MAKKTPEINATSTADIAFLLLVFFLATTTMNVDSGYIQKTSALSCRIMTERPEICKTEYFAGFGKPEQSAGDQRRIGRCFYPERQDNRIYSESEIIAKTYPKRKSKRSIFSVPWKFRKELFLFKVIKVRHTKCILPYKIN